MDNYGIQGAQVNYFARDFYVYELDFAAVAPGAASTASFNVQADSDFLWTSAAFFADIAAGAQLESTKIIPLMSILITDTGSGRQLMNTAVPITSLFGDGKLPFMLPRQRPFRANSTVTATVNNFDAAATYNLRLAFIGEKGFK